MKILGVRVDNLSYTKTLKKIEEFVASRKPHQICTVNPEFIIAAQEDSEFRHIINNADLCTPDGAGLLLVTKIILHQPIYERVTGTDLVEKIASISQKNGYRIFLLGGEHSSGKKTANFLQKKYPQLNIVGIYEGRPKIRPITKKLWRVDYNIKKTLDMTTSRNPHDPNLDIIRKITKTHPHILLVAYGAPKQDKFIARYEKELNVPVMIGVGGAYDFISGRAKRAPKIFQIFWLEWLWRLFNQPWRIKRIYTATIKFILAVIWNKMFYK